MKQIWPEKYKEAEALLDSRNKIINSNGWKITFEVTADKVKIIKTNEKVLLVGSYMELNHDEAMFLRDWLKELFE